MFPVIRNIPTLLIDTNSVDNDATTIARNDKLADNYYPRLTIPQPLHRSFEAFSNSHSTN